MKKSFLVLTLTVFVFGGCAPKSVSTSPQRVIVTVPVADIRTEPSAGNLTYDYDAGRETQVLRGEPLLVLEKKDGWLRVQSPLQMEYTHHSTWEGYPGWIEEKYVSYDTSLEETPDQVLKSEKELREEVIRIASRHLGNQYLWGGRSLHDAGVAIVPTGVDCSGLVSWTFLQIGWLVPRDSHEQFMKAKRIKPAQMQRGDLLFLAKVGQPDKIVHVAFYLGQDRLLEAPQTGLNVREMTFEQRFGAKLSKMKNGMVVGDRIIFFGTFFGADL